MGETSSNPQVLLQMLMPIVRPDGIAPTRRSENLPLEDQSFEQMLERFGQTNPVQSDTVSAMQDDDQDTQPTNMLAQLGSMDRIENTTLRDMLSRNTQASASDSSVIA